MITLPRSTLLAALSPLVPVCETKTAQNILSHVLITAWSDHVQLTATDYDITMRSKCAATIAELGGLTVPAKMLADALKTLPDKDVTLRSLDNHWAELRCGASKFRLPGLPTVDYPDVKTPDWTGAATVPARLLADVLAKTAFSASHDETRPALCGVYLDAKPDGGELRLMAVSTDGHRLSKSEALGGDSGAGPWDAIVGNKAVSVLSKLLTSGNVAVRCHAGNLDVKVGDIEFSARQLDETFPDYTRVIPTNNRNRLQVTKVALVGALRRVSLMTSAKTSIVKLAGSNDLLRLSAHNPEAGEATDELPVDFDGAFEVGVNHKYLLDVLGAITGETVTIAVADQFSPLLITSTDDEGSLFVVMPMRV